jgi:heme A synthase
VFTRIDRRIALKLGITAVVWVLLTATLGAAVVYSSTTFEGLISPNLDGSVFFIAAFLLAAMLGVLIETPKALLPLTALMCLVGAACFAVVYFAPSWAGITVRTTAAENFATTRVMLFFALMLLPAMVGAMLGNLAGGFLNPRHEILRDPSDIAVEQNTWWTSRARNRDQE